METKTFKTIKNCYDSHTHFLATGQVASELNLRHLKSAEDVQLLKIEKHHFRQDWLVGFGWNHLDWSEQKWPSKSILDQYFPNFPVLFSRIDGHASWLNSKAIERLKSLGHENPAEILVDQDHIQALMKLPDYTDDQIRQFLIKSGKIFNQGGFTHVRDLSMTYRQWKIQKELSLNDQLDIYCEGFVTAESIQDLDRAHEQYKLCLEDPCDRLRIKGLKIFIDGSLGSKTAYLSKNYFGENHRGTLLWTAADIKLAIAYCWRNKMEIAIHCIGDEAVHTAALSARDVSAAGLLGKIHLEHVQLLRNETLPLLKPLHVYVHMQPCHWLSDQSWLGQCIPELKKELFQWEVLRKNKIHVLFGSDSPIEVSHLLRTPEALNSAAQAKIPALSEDWTRFHAHPSSSWGFGETVFADHQLISVTLDQKKLLTD